MWANQAAFSKDVQSLLLNQGHQDLEPPVPLQSGGGAAVAIRLHLQLL